MSVSRRVRLVREVRFGVPAGELARMAVEERNTWAGEPGLEGVGAFVTVRVGVSGEVDEQTGMVLNITRVDEVVRALVASMVQEYYPPYRTAAGAGATPSPRGGGDLVVRLKEALDGKFAGCRVEWVELGLSPYLQVTAMNDAPGRVQMTERFEFSAAHRLHSDKLTPAENRAVFGKCNNPNGHGHNYEVAVTVEGVPEEGTGIVIPVRELQRVVNERVIERFDHQHLNVDCTEFRVLNPTVENIARVIWEKLEGAFGGVRLKRVRVWETPKTWAEYEG